MFCLVTSCFILKIIPPHFWSLALPHVAVWLPKCYHLSPHLFPISLSVLSVYLSPVLCLKSHTSVLTLNILSTKVRSHWEVCKNAVHCEYPDVALKTVKKLSVELWTLLTLNGRHLGYVAEGEGLLFKLKMAAGYVVTTPWMYKENYTYSVGTSPHYTNVSYTCVFSTKRMLTLANANAS